MYRVYFLFAFLLLQYHSAAAEFEPMMLEAPRVTYEEQVTAMSMLATYEFDIASEMLGHPRSDIMMGGYSGVSQYNVAMFRGIKYATAERFKMPVKFPKPAGVVMALEAGPSCPQPSLDFFKNPDEYSEDCLYLDVYVPLRRSITFTPDTGDMSADGSGGSGAEAAVHAIDEMGSTADETSEGSAEWNSEETTSFYHNLPIIISIRGEGFSYVESRRLDGRALAQHGKAIVVIINYRTSALGFLSSGDHHVAGNFGLYDQRVAIQWVREHAALFGGDADCITLLGYSSGAECVAAQMHNPMNSRGLFQRVVLQSSVSKQGTMFYNDMAQEKAVQKYLFHKLADMGECGSDAMTCLKEMNVTQLIGIAGSLAFERKDNRTFGPIQDDNYFATSANPDDDLISQYDIMLGTVESEAAMWVGGLPSNSTLFGVIRHLFASNSHFHCFPERLARFLEFEYRSQEDVDAVTAVQHGFLDLVSDYSYVVPIVTFANKAVMGGANPYLYQFKAYVPTTDADRPDFLAGIASHGDDQSFLYGLPIAFMDLFSSEARNVSANYIRMITNFAHTGDPDDGPTPKPHSLPAWEPYDVKNMGTYIIAEEMEMKYRVFARSTAVWTEFLTYLMSDEVCEGVEQPEPEPEPTPCHSSCSYRAKWEADYKKWREVDLPRWREAADRYDTIAEKVNSMTSCDDESP